MSKNLMDRILSKVMTEANTGCWLWEGSDRNTTVRWRGKSLNARIVTFEYMYGEGACEVCDERMLPVPGCGNKWCVSPEHLVLIDRYHLAKTQLFTMLARTAPAARKAGRLRSESNMSDIAKATRARLSGEAALKRGSGAALKSYNDAKRVPVNQYSRDGTFIARHPSLCEAARVVGTRRGNISATLSGKRKTAAGFLWRYATDGDP